LAFFTLQNDALKIESPGYPYKTPPAVKIGRFGVSTEFQSQSIGTDIITMIKDFMCLDNRTGCRYITVDAYNKPRVLRFYQKNGFTFLKTPNPQRKQEPMYFDLLSHVPLFVRQKRA
jgi:ribosomal protein S18 acetylase RimI-like enzyme